MKGKKSTKNALFTSVLALVLCVAMLIGTTFAWFTDTASTAVNKIQAGTLDVELLAENGASLEGQTLTWQKAAGAPAGEQVLWEPGCTYNLQSFKIRNNGTLAMKYQIAITGIVGDADLLPAIEFTVTGLTGATTATTLNNFEGSLAPNSETGLITITGKMKTDAGNEYQGKSIDGIGITVRATQLGGTFEGVTGEYDSTGNEYDKDAPYCEWPVFVPQAIAKDENGAITDQTLTKYVSEDIQAQVEIPAAAISESATQMILKVEKTTAPANFTVGAGQDSKTYEVTVEGLKENNDTPVKAKIFVGIGLTHVTLTHNGDEAFTDVGSAESFTGADKTFYYNSTDGYIYFASMTFSPFSAAFDAPVGISGAGTMKETYYPTAEAAQEAAYNGIEVTATQKVENVPVGDNEETVEQGQTFKMPVARFNEVKYYTLEEAISAAESGATVTLINTVQLSATVKIEKSIIIDLNGNVVSSTAVDGFTVKGATLTFTDSDPEKTGRVEHTGKDDMVWVKSGGQLLINDGTYSSTGRLGIVYGTSGIGITGGRFNVAPKCADGYYASLKEDGYYHVERIEYWKDFAEEYTITDKLIEIATPQQLAMLYVKSASGETFSGYTVKLTADIDLAGKYWNTIPKPFSGIFDGDGHTIRNMHNITSANYGEGFFTDIRNTVRNVTFDNATVASNEGNVYGIVTGYAYGTVTFENVHVINSKLIGYGKVGAILGMAADPGGVTTVKNCSVKNTAISATYNAASMIGLAQNTVAMSGCSVENVTWNRTGWKYLTVSGLKTLTGTKDVSGIYWDYYGIYAYAGWSDYYNDYYNAKSGGEGTSFILEDGTQRVFDGYCHNTYEEPTP